MLRFGRHAAVCAILLLGPAFWLAPPTFWNLDHRLWLVLGGSVLAYLATLASLSGRAGPAGTIPPRTVLVHFGAWSALWLLAIVLWESGLFGAALPVYSRVALLAGLATGLAGLLLTTSSKPTSWIALSVIAVAGLLALAGQALYYKGLLPPAAQPRQIVSRLDTSLYQLQLTSYVDSIPAHWRRGGGLADWGTDYLLATGDGRLYVFNEDTDRGGLRTTQLPYRVPLNPEEFSASAAEIFSHTPNNYVESARFRVGSILVQDSGDTRRLLVSHHYWNVAESCFTLRLSALEGAAADFHADAPVLQWRTVYDAVPCLKLNTTNPSGPRFEGLENGGRMVALGPEEILLTVGDHGFDGVTRPEALSQDPDSHHGKIMRVNLADGSARVFSSGHRNPQGLYVDASGEIWATEHGPRGGDELNRIVEGANYGWPLATYGTDYARRSWPLNPRQGRHDDFEGPVYSFVPSVGLSVVTGVTSERFASWEGDLLIGSLRGQTLYRARIRDDRVIFAEVMPVGQRIRDLHFGHDGRLLVWTDESTIIVIEPTEANDGEAVAAQCRACHGLSPWDSSTALGPNIGELIGRRVASRTDFIYSQALQNLGGRWTHERLDAFLANPQAFAPGTTMAFPGIADPGQRRLLIEYLGNTASQL